MLPISCGLPCWDNEEQTGCSKVLRITAVVLGIIALLIGVLILSGVPTLDSLGTTAGGLLAGGGGLLFLSGLCLRSVLKKLSENLPETQVVNSHIKTLIPSQMGSDEIDEGVTEIILDLTGFRGTDIFGKCSIPGGLLEQLAQEQQQEILKLKAYTLEKESFDKLLTSYPNINRLSIKLDPWVLRQVIQPDIKIIYEKFELENMRHGGGSTRRYVLKNT